MFAAYQHGPASELEERYEPCPYVVVYLQVTPEAKFKDDLGLDSLDTVEVTARRLRHDASVIMPATAAFIDKCTLFCRSCEVWCACTMPCLKHQHECHAGGDGI